MRISDWSSDVCSSDLLGMKGFALGAVTMMFIGNPLSGMATTAAWLPAGWGALGQLLPPGAAGASVRSMAFFDGHGAPTPLLVLVCWLAVGIALRVAAGRTKASAQVFDPGDPEQHGGGK